MLTRERAAEGKPPAQYDISNRILPKKGRRRVTRKMQESEMLNQKWFKKIKSEERSDPPAKQLTGEEQEPQEEGKSKPELHGRDIVVVEEGADGSSDKGRDGGDHPCGVDVLNVPAGGDPGRDLEEGDEHRSRGANPKEHPGSDNVVIVNEVCEEDKVDKGDDEGVAP